MAGREKCTIHNAYKVAWDPETNQLVCNQCLFEKQLKSHKAGEIKVEEHEFNQQHIFTALITRDLKTKFDNLYKTYKDGLCDVAEIEHSNVKEILTEQAKTFF